MKRPAPSPRFSPLPAVIVAACAVLFAPLPATSEEFREITVPEPLLEHLEPAVRDQLTAARAMVKGVVDSHEVDPEKRARAYGELGQMYHAYELSEAAEASYRNAVALDPAYFEWNYSLGYLLKGAGRCEEALPFLKKALEGRPASSYLMQIRIGECYRALNEPQRAREAFEAALQYNPDGPAVLARLGELAVEEKRFSEAVSFLAKALEFQPAANRLHYPLAMAYRGLGDEERARAHLGHRGMVGVQPPDPFRQKLNRLVTGYRVHLLAGRLAFAAGRFTEAVEEFRQAVKEKPESAGARINYGTALARQEKYRAARDQFEEAVRLDPENGTARYNLGSLVMFFGDFDTAVGHLVVAAKKNPEDAQVRLVLAESLQKSDRFQEAMEVFKSAVRLDPSRSEGWIGISLLLQAAGQHREALGVLEEASGRIPHDGGIARALAHTLAASPALDLRDGDRALTLAENIFRARPSPEHARLIAMAYAEKDACDDAVAWQERAVEMAMEVPEERFRMPQLHRNLKHFREQRPCRVPGAPASGAQE